MLSMGMKKGIYSRNTVLIYYLLHSCINSNPKSASDFVIKGVSPVLKCAGENAESNLKKGYVKLVLINPISLSFGTVTGTEGTPKKVLAGKDK